MNDNTRVFNMNCMDGMKEFPDKYFDLAIVDPPYGIGNFKPQAGKTANLKFEPVTWNDSIPPLSYFNELERISKNKIIWGANYYNCFPDGGGAIVWDKKNHNPKMSRYEIASCTHHKRVTYFVYEWQGYIAHHETGGSIHPCEKPISLYKWLLKNYAKEGDKILDTHLGSGSSRIAAFDMGFDFTGYELDKDYFEASEKRFTQHKSQLTLKFS